MESWIVILGILLAVVLLGSLQQRQMKENFVAIWNPQQMGGRRWWNGRWWDDGDIDNDGIPDRFERRRRNDGDIDNDGIPDRYESPWWNDGDIDNDGIPDRYERRRY